MIIVNVLSTAMWGGIVYTIQDSLNGFTETIFSRFFQLRREEDYLIFRI
jgi:hypothetical protein